MANFSVVNSTVVAATTAGSTQAAMATTYKTLITVGNSTGSLTNIGAGALRRGKIYDLLFGTNGTPADNFMEFEVVRITMGASTVLAGGLSSLSSAMALDLADNYGAVAAIGINSSIETAYTAITETFYVGINQRASYRWVASPGSELVYPSNSSATGSNGFGMRARSGGYTGTATANLLFCEQ